MMVGQAVFERALGELKERRMAPAVWARALAEADGDKHKAVSIYIRYRVEQIEKAAAHPAEAIPLSSPTQPLSANSGDAMPPPLPSGFDSHFPGQPPALSQSTSVIRIPPQPLEAASQVRLPPVAPPRINPVVNPGHSDLTVMMGEGGAEFPRTGLMCARTRYRARMLDAVIVSCLYFGILLYVHSGGAQAGSGEAILPAGFGWLQMAILLVAIIMLDTVQYLVFGNSLGKTLYGVEVRYLGQRIGRGRYALRNLAVWGLGLGCSLPFVSFGTQVWQYFRLKAGKQAFYDDMLDTQTVCRRDRPGLWLLGDAILALAAIAYTVMYAFAQQF